MKTSHTLGPWHISAGRYINNTLNRVAKIDFAWQSDEEQMANLHLISTAPDLLAALEALIRMQVKGHDLIDRMQFSDEGRAISAQVMGAIAKARGAL